MASIEVIKLMNSLLSKQKHLKKEEKSHANKRNDEKMKITLYPIVIYLCSLIYSNECVIFYSLYH